MHLFGTELENVLIESVLLNFSWELGRLSVA